MSTVSADTLLAKNKENPVIVYSKTYCPYCSEGATSESTKTHIHTLYCFLLILGAALLTLSFSFFLRAVKSLFKELKVPAKVVELDDLADGDAVQSTLSGITGMRTVPQVFIGGKLVGGCDGTKRRKHCCYFKDSPLKLILLYYLSMFSICRYLGGL